MASGSLRADWRRDLRRKIGSLLLVKLLALITLWSLFFSPEHRVRVTTDGLGERLAVETTGMNNPNSPRENRHD